jgi:hypothetical protein
MPMATGLTFELSALVSSIDILSITNFIFVATESFNGLNILTAEAKFGLVELG